MANGLLLNVGNTHTEAAIWNGESMSGKRRFQTAGLSRDDAFHAVLQRHSGDPVVIACVVPANAASVAVLQRIGMTFERRARLYDEDHAIYALRR